MPIGGKGRSLWARAVAAILMVLLIAAPPVAHLVLPHVSADQSGLQYAHHHGDAAIGSVLASGDDSSHEMRGLGGDCASVKGFCADCSYFCHPVFDIAGEHLIENQGRLAVYSTPDTLSKGVVPDVLPRPPQLG